MKVLVFGASGMIGSAMFRVISATPGWEVWGTLRSAAAKRFFSGDQQDKLVSGVDVEKHDALVQMFARVKPDVVVNCIGLTKHHKEAEDPQLAHAYALASGGTEGFVSSDEYMREFRNQVLDFVSANPPRYGVNWACTMDVGVRIANWLMAHDLFVASGARFDDEFELVFLQSVYQHGQHIINNLEWHAELRNNHYLGDIVGLLFVAAYLPCSSETDAWLAFAVQELVVEVKEQFYEDGGNFEASTSYHRLSTGHI